jgi:hypothetical protein
MVVQLIAIVVMLVGCGSVTPFDDDTDIETDTAGDTVEETNDPIPDTILDEGETIPDVSDTGGPDDGTETTEDTTEDGDAIGDEPEVHCVVCYRDFDMDGYGRDDDTVCQETCTGSYVSVGGDCCDGEGEVHPGQEGWFLEPYTCPGESWDYNCNGAEDYRYPATPLPTWNCPSFGGTNEEECESHGYWADGTPGICGEMESGTSCMWVDGLYCTSGGFLTQYCH